jgi:hypothetical protein
MKKASLTRNTVSYRKPRPSCYSILPLPLIYPSTDDAESFQTQSRSHSDCQKLAYHAAVGNISIVAQVLGPSVIRRFCGPRSEGYVPTAVYIIHAQLIWYIIMWNIRKVNNDNWLTMTNDRYSLQESMGTTKRHWTRPQITLCTRGAIGIM